MTIVPLLLACAHTPATDTPLQVVAHRGVHQTFSMDGVTGETCTASRIYPPTHGLIENTLPSMHAAFAYGAAAVEVDVHRTADGHLAVLHDAGLDCRTDGHGAPEEHTLAALQALDLGYGYTSDGQTFPLRGQGVGLLVTLPEVLATFPGRRFVIDIKTNHPEDGEAVADALAALSPAARAQQIVYGGPEAVARVVARFPEVRSFDKPRIKACLKGYLAYGWTGIVPAACHDTWVAVPIDATPLIWGFPRRFEARMARVGSEVVLVGPREGQHAGGMDTLEDLARVPDDFRGWIWTNRIELIRPALDAEAE